VRAAQNLAVDGHHPLTLPGKRRHEPLERGTELCRVEQPEQPAERVMTGQAVLQTEELAQERFFRLGKFGHVRRVLPTAQDRAQGDHQQVVEIVQGGIAGSRVFETLPAGSNLFQSIPQRPGVTHRRLESMESRARKMESGVKVIRNASPLCGRRRRDDGNREIGLCLGHEC
jgi:hypothetical protein